MDHLDHFRHFRGTFQEKLAELEQERDELIAQARGFVPKNFMEMLEASEDGEIDHELDWVCVPDPRSNDCALALEVLPVLGLWIGDSEEDGSPIIEPGLARLTLLGKLPGGKVGVIGVMAALGGESTPLLSLNKSIKDPSETHSVNWETADAELFLKLAKSALDAQNATGELLSQSTEVPFHGPRFQEGDEVQFKDPVHFGYDKHFKDLDVVNGVFTVTSVKIVEHRPTHDDHDEVDYDHQTVVIKEVPDWKFASDRFKHVEAVDASKAE